MYGIASAVTSIPFRHMHDYVAYRSVSLLSSFIGSFAMYALCRVLWHRRISLFRAFLFCLGLAALVGFLSSTAAIWAENHWGGAKMDFHWDSVFASTPGGSFVMVAWSALYFGIKHYQALEEQRLRLAASESLAREAQLRALRYQLHPHFLFNTLNAISTLVLDNQPRVATQMIAKLADLLRSTLDAPDTHQVSLAEEVALTEEYLAIEKVRFGPRLNVVFAIAEETREAQVPRFLLQPLVENAVRHGIAKRPQGGEIVIRSSAKEGGLLLQIENEGISPDDITVTDTSSLQSHGLGLVNTRTRLQQIYDSSAGLETRAFPNGSFEVSISMPLRVAEHAGTDRELLSLQ